MTARLDVLPTRLDGPMLLRPQSFGDERGFFSETYRRSDLAALGVDEDFVQDNHSRSARGVLRGLHFQKGDKAQGKLVRVVAGAVFDVAVDIRRASPTFGRWVGVELSADNHRQLWVPPGLAHGFLVLSESADFLYKTTEYYSPQDEGAVRWDDPDLAIAWPDLGEAPRLSAKDAAAPSLRDLA